MTERVIETPEGPLAYHLLGEGIPRVAVLPGWALSVPFLRTTAIWAAWEAWCQRFPTLILERRGAGGSRAHRGDITSEQMAADLLACLDDACATTVTVWAHADATLAAFILAMRWPERIERLVLQSPFARLLAAPDHPQGMPLEDMLALAMLNPDAPAINELATLGTAPDAAGDARTRFQSSIAAGLLPRLLTDVAMTDARPVLTSIRLPTLVLHGEADSVIPPSSGQEVARSIPGARFALIEGMGHLPGPEAMDAMMERAAAFIEGKA